MKTKGYVLVIVIVAAAFAIGKTSSSHHSKNISLLEVGDKVDSLDGIYVYYNGEISHTGKRNKTNDGYNLGLRYQCVEFVKRYYYYHYKHKMPDAYGNAKDFFDAGIKDGKRNKARNLVQFSNPSGTKPKKGDLLIFDGHRGNPYGHVAIVSAVSLDNIEIIQQNPGPLATSRIIINFNYKNGKYYLINNRLLGWLRKED